MHITRFTDAETRRETRDMFSGEVSIANLVQGMRQVAVNLVRFSPGGRTKWHRHTFEQTLIVVEGRGIIATEEQEHMVEPGTVAVIPAQEKHWHGATDTSGMAHLAVNLEGESIVIEPVTEIRTPGV